MHGAHVTKLRHNPEKFGLITLTPEMATELLEHNQLNRPINQQHVHRIANQISIGKWKYNGDTIKIAEDDDVLDGQHRCWAVLEANKPIQTLIVYGIARDAFSTIDTLRKPRSGSDVIALSGTIRHRNIIASALAWMIRWQRGSLVDYKAPQNRIENSDIEEAFKAHAGIVRAIDRAMTVRGIGNPSIIGFVYYILANRNLELAERMIETLREPGRTGVDDPFFRLRGYFTADHHKRKETVMTIALIFKAVNAAHLEQKIKVLSWRNQGKAAELFPVLQAGEVKARAIR